MKKFNNMKKMLISLGAIGAVAAPVAAVVSCNSGNKTAKSAGNNSEHTASLPAVGTVINDPKQLESLISDLSYEIQDSDADNQGKLSDLLIGAKVTGAHQGLINDNKYDVSHSKNDFVILFNNNNEMPKTAAQVEPGMTTFDARDYDLVTTDTPEEEKAKITKTTLSERWGVTENEFNNSTIMVFIRSADGDISSVSYTEIVKVGDKFYQTQKTSDHEFLARLISR